MPLSLVSLEGEGRRNETYTVKVAQLMMIISLVGFHEELGRTLTQREIQNIRVEEFPNVLLCPVRFLLGSDEHRG